MFKLSRFAGLALLALSLAAPSQAALLVNIGGSIVGGTVVGGVTYTDNQIGVDSNPTIGVLDMGAFLDTVATNFRINGFTALSASPLGSVAATANVNLRPEAVVPFSVNIFLTDVGFLLPPAPLALSQTVNLLSSVGGVTASATSMGFYGASNTAFDVSGASTTDALASVKGGVASNAPGNSGTINGGLPYSLTTYIKLDIIARGGDPIQNLQVNSNLSSNGVNGPVIPEPTTTAAAGLGLLAMAFGFKKFRKA